LHYFIGYKTKNIKIRYATTIEKNINEKKKFVFSLLENENIWITPSLPLIEFIFKFHKKHIKEKFK